MAPSVVHVVADPECELHQEWPTTPNPEKRCPTCRALPPEGWLPFGSLIDYDGPAECSEETGEDGLPLWERPIPPGGADRGEE